MIKAEDFLNSRVEFIKYLGFDFVSKKTCVGVIQEFSDMQNKGVMKENKELIEWINYWKKRCLLSERCLEESPCDPDITEEQINA